MRKTIEEIEKELPLLNYYSYYNFDTFIKEDIINNHNLYKNKLYKIDYVFYLPHQKKRYFVAFNWKELTDNEVIETYYKLKFQEDFIDKL